MNVAGTMHLIGCLYSVHEQYSYFIKDKYWDFGLNAVFCNSVRYAVCHLCMVTFIILTGINGLNYVQLYTHAHITTPPQLFLSFQ